MHIVPTNYVTSVWELFLNIWFIVDPRNEGLSAFIYKQSNNMDEEFKAATETKNQISYFALKKFYQS